MNKILHVTRPIFLKKIRLNPFIYDPMTASGFLIEDYSMSSLISLFSENNQLENHNFKNSEGYKSLSNSGAILPRDSSLRLIKWNITNLCNLRCKHCYAKSGEISKGELPTEKVLDIISFLTSLKLHYIELGGGECLYRDDIKIILKALRELKCYKAISTNATLIDEEMIQDLKASKIESARISLDGPNSASHDFIRGKGSFDKTIEGINQLKKFGIKFRIGSVLTSKNFNFIEDLIRLCKSLGASSIKISSISKSGRAKEYFNKIEPLDHSKLKKQLFKSSWVHKYYEDFIQIGNMDEILQYGLFIDYNGNFTNFGDYDIDGYIPIGNLLNSKEIITMKRHFFLEGQASLKKTLIKTNISPFFCIFPNNILSNADKR